jgi:hypothetical protein
LYNLLQSMKLVLKYGYILLPIRLCYHLIIDLVMLPGKRRPVTRQTYQLFRKLAKQPVRDKPAATIRDHPIERAN